MIADSVICARSTPKQKAKIVSFVRSRGKVCIAIGDGANDVNMIRVSSYQF
jgi:phospholipid-translocating ATPase